jgi:hypothetical protein
MQVNPDLPYMIIYKLACLLSGITICYLGYLLFVKGFLKSAGEVEGEYQGIRLTIKKGAPGTFFSVLGATVLCFTIFSKIHSTVQNETPLVYNLSDSTQSKILSHVVDSLLNIRGEQEMLWKFHSLEGRLNVDTSIHLKEKGKIIE